MPRLTYGGHTYLAVTTPLNWSQADANAKAIGGHLAKIESAAENAAIFSFALREAPSWLDHCHAGDGGDAEYLWIGASDLATEGNWRWSDGSAVTYANWGYGGEPDNFEDQDGGALGLQSWPQPDGGLGNAGQWNDVDVSNLLYSIIEYDGLAGTTSADTVKGTAKADAVLGLAGNDTIWGLAGNDTLTGGAGKDAFVFNTRLSATSNVDRIADFSVKDDTIRLENAIFTKLKTGPLAASAFYKGSKAHDSSDRIIYDKVKGALYYDPDGTGSSKPIKFATLDKGLAMTHADFLVI